MKHFTRIIGLVSVAVIVVGCRTIPMTSSKDQGYSETLSRLLVVVDTRDLECQINRDQNHFDTVPLADYVAGKLHRLLERHGVESESLRMAFLDTSYGRIADLAKAHQQKAVLALSIDRIEEIPIESSRPYSTYHSTLFKNYFLLSVTDTGRVSDEENTGLPERRVWQATATLSTAGSSTWGAFSADQLCNTVVETLVKDGLIQ